MALEPRFGSDEKRLTLTSEPSRSTAADHRIRELQVQLSLVREVLANRQTQIQSLEQSLNLNIMENVRLSGRIAESFTAINDAHSRLEQTKQALLDAQAEADETNERSEAVIRSLTAQLEAMSAKVANAEQQVAEARHIVLACIEQKIEDKRVISNAESALQQKEQQIEELKLSNGNLINQIKTRDTALNSAEQRIGVLSALVDQLQANAKHTRAKRAIQSAAPPANETPVVCVMLDAIRGKPATNSLLLKRDLDKDAWLFGEHKAARLS
jgi:DNA repair exonuclease SbcCD ATPase subunit